MSKRQRRAEKSLGLENPTDREIHQRLLDLALDARSYLRQNARPAVRISAALLLAASLAACSADGGSSSSGSSSVSPLTQEVRTGLPSTPGQYSVVPNSVQRNAQGVYTFRWRDAGDSTSDGSLATVSLLQLAKGDTDYLDMPAQGDPTLYLPNDEPIQITSSTGGQQGFNGGVGPGIAYWRPFYLGGPVLPGYYNPPQSTVQSSTTIDGSSRSSAPPPPEARTTGVAGAVSGRAGGAGSGTAASSKAGAPIGSPMGSSHAASAPSSGGFSSGGLGAAGGKAGGGSASS